MIAKFSILILILFISCANPMPPSGGPPDKTPPEIINSEPLNGTKNFHGNSIVLEFNKYMDKNKVNENIYVSPDKKIKFDWSGKELEIEFDDNLDSNTTYAVNIGTDYTDLKQNKPSQSYTLIFSTGNYLDSGAIQGQLFDKDPAGAYIFAYNIDKIKADTLNINTTKPNYRVQIGTNGKFKVLALKEAKYRLFAIRDKFKDGIYNEGVDNFSAPSRDVLVFGDSIPYLNFQLGPPIDNVGPMLYGSESIFNNLIAMDFSEPLDTLSLNPKGFELQDSLRTKKIDIQSVIFSPESGNKLLLSPAEHLDTSIVWELTVLNNQFGIKDTIGNLIQDTMKTTFFMSRSEYDTTKLKLIKIPFKDSMENIELLPKMDFVFNCGILNKNIKNRISLISADSSEKIKFIAKWLSDNYLSITTIDNLKSNTYYLLSLKLDSLKHSKDKYFKDSTLILHFKTKDTRKFGGAKGKVKDIVKADSLLKIVFLNSSNQRFETSVADSGKWELPKLPADKYKVEIYYDKDKNYKFSFGKPFPFIYSEDFIILQKEIEINPRWTKEIVLPSPLKK